MPTHPIAAVLGIGIIIATIWKSEALEEASGYVLQAEWIYLIGMSIGFSIAYMGA